MKDLQFRTLRADEIEVRESGTKNGWTSFLLYKDARVDMRLLDEVVGCFEWQREHKELKGVIYCGVSIWNKELSAWITKWDAGKESNTEAEKGEASDSFKRACFNWGIGRELYTAPTILIKQADMNGQRLYLRVSEITYNDKREISSLVLKDKDGKVWFTYPRRKAAEQPKPAPIQNKSYKDMTAEDAFEVIDAAAKSKEITDIMNAMKAENRTLFDKVYPYAMSRYNTMKNNNK